ncbi:MAG: phage portal protein [Prevotella sp.]|nr:phage portal protein [Prevotella sp.]MDE6152302.1 phage portal protein [Prevotella sp.]
MKTVEYLLSHPDELLKKKPFFRGSATPVPDEQNDGDDIDITGKIRAVTPRVDKTVVSQSRFLKELDPNSHEVMFDDNLPSVCVKLKGGDYYEIKFKRMGIPYQQRIREKQTLCLCGNNTIFTMRGATPSDEEKANFDMIKEYWIDRNMDGWRTKAVYTQKGMGDAGLLFYYNRMGEIKCRLISYEDGYVIISHNDDNGERLLECVYYRDENNAECIDCYDDKNIYRLRQGGNGWAYTTEPHGFSEIPLATKRGDVAWNPVQSIIEMYETLYNLFIVIQKRHGWGILYVRGRFKENAQQIAGNIVLNDTSIDGNGSAEFKTPPSPQGVIDTLLSLEEQIQKGSSTTFLLPKDVKSSGDISALAIMLTQSLDIEGANNGVIEWQNFIDKMMRLFIEGLANELVKKGINKTAKTDFKKLRISAKLKVWRPFNESEYNQMLATMKGAGLISQKTAVESNTVSAPDECARIHKELEDALAEEQEKLRAQAVTTNNTSATQTTTTEE